MRIIPVSRETSELVASLPEKKLEIYSYLPCDRAGCPCQDTIMQWKRNVKNLTESQRVSNMEDNKFIVCPRDKTGMKRYQIICNNCGETLGYCWATDNTLSDWCDFHYTQWTDGTYWYGCFTPHISPVTQELCFECCCGQDTRDFKANMKLPYNVAMSIEASNSVGREFGQADSKFKVRKVSAGVLAFT
jgi:hypothetical protein